MHKFVLSVVVAFLMGSCGFGPAHDPLVGKWANDSDSWEFFKDGTVIGTAQGTSFTAKYARLDDHRVKIEITNATGGIVALVFTYSINGDILTLENEVSGGSASKYKRRV